MAETPQNLMSVLATLMLNNKLQQKRPVPRRPVEWPGQQMRPAPNMPMPMRGGVSANPPGRMAQMAEQMLGGNTQPIPMPHPPVDGSGLPHVPNGNAWGWKRAHGLPVNKLHGNFPGSVTFPRRARRVPGIPEVPMQHLM